MNSDFAPLRDLRVVEVSHMIFGPCCGMFLAYLGAEVIKVEPVAGDKTRQLTGMGASFFPTFNRGKKSVMIDMSRPEGRTALDTLLSTADVLLENFRDSSLEGMGLDPDRLKARFPRLVTVSCKGFLRGPYEGRSALDEVVQMMTGLAYMTGPPGQPLRAGSSVNDIMGGLFGAYAVLAALRERESTDEGRTIRVGLFENSLLLVAQHMVQYELLGTEPEPMPNRAFSWPVYDIFTTADGRDIFIGAVTDGQWKTICDILDLDNLCKHPDLQSKMDQINARNWTIPVFAKAVKSREFAELTAQFETAGLPFAPVTRPAEMYDDPQANASGGLSSSQLPDGGEIHAPGMPVEIDGERVGGILNVPGLGTDTLAVFRELGFDEEFIERASGGQ